MARYTVDGIEYPSVTSILGETINKHFLIDWAVGRALEHIIRNPHDVEGAYNAHKTASGDAKDIGSEAHEIIETYVKGKLKGQDYECFETSNPLVKQFLDWENDVNPEWIASEIRLVEQTNGYAGTADAVAMIDGKVTLIDFKTSKAIYPEYWKQCDLYAIAYNNSIGSKYDIVFKNDFTETTDLMNAKPIEWVGILRLDKEGDQYEWKNCGYNYENDSGVLFAVKWYYAMKNRKLKNNPWR